MLPLHVTAIVVAPGGAHGAHQEASLPVRGYDAAEERGEAVQTSGLGVGAGGRVPLGEWAGGKGRVGLNHALLHFPIQVLEILKLREEEEEAHTLTISIYDTKRNEKSKEYREAMVSLSFWSRP